MGEPRKMMNAQKIEITEADRKRAMATFMNAPVINIDDALKEYKETLDQYCIEFKASSHEELMTRADELEFDDKICNEILDKYSFIQRHKLH
jgi:hypothetical protein